MDRIKTIYFGLQIEVSKSTFRNCFYLSWTEWKNLYHLDKQDQKRQSFWRGGISLVKCDFLQRRTFLNFCIFQRDKERKKTWGRLSLSLMEFHRSFRATSAGGIFALGNTVGLGVDQTLTHLLYCALKCEKLFYIIFSVKTNTILMEKRPHHLGWV